MRKPLIAATLVGLLALVAFGSRSGAWGGDEGPREISSTAIDYAMTLGVIVLVGLMIVAIASIRSMKGQVELERASGLKQLIVFLTVLTVLGYIGISNLRPQPQQEEETDAVSGQSREEEREDAILPRDRRSPELQWWLLVVAGAAGTAAVIWYRWKPRRERERDVVVAEQLTAVLTETLDDLEFERDARRAVIRAYARMEAVLAAHGLPRLPYEAPLEYLARILRELKVRAGAAHALTELFERAKFSQHEIDAAMKQEAIQALATVRDDLKAAA